MEARLRPGQRLVERELTERIGVSRTTVREAIGELAAYGLVTTIPHKGAIVSVPSLQEAAELYDVRALLEGADARQFAERASPPRWSRCAKHSARVSEARRPRISGSWCRRRTPVTVFCSGCSSPSRKSGQASRRLKPVTVRLPLRQPPTTCVRRAAAVQKLCSLQSCGGRTRLTSSQGQGTWDSCLSAFSLLPGRATRPWERHCWWSHERGDCHGSRLPGQSPYMSHKRHPTSPLRVGRAPRQQAAQALRAGLPAQPPTYGSCYGAISW